MSRFTLSLLLALVSSSFACGAIGSALDCRAICSRYASCFDAAYDVGACESRCRTNSEADRDYRRRADHCNACIDDRACSTVGFSCATQCSSIVP